MTGCSSPTTPSRRFYARDKGRAILAEVLDLIRSAATNPATT